MNHRCLYCFLWLILLSSCHLKQTTDDKELELPIFVTPQIPSSKVDKADLVFNKENSRWTLNQSLYSGMVISYFPNGALREEFAVLNGRKQNMSRLFYKDGHLKNEAHYHEGKLHGIKKSWSSGPDHQLLSELNYFMGKGHGEQRKWYSTGETYQIINLNQGKEEGMQKAYRKNGDLYANYEAKNGRVFGLKKAALCFGLEDEKIQYAD